MSEISINESGPKKMDPGWNDPPMLNYSTANPPPKSRITNKRIAFPLGKATPDSTTNNVPSASDMNFPPGPPKN